MCFDLLIHKSTNQSLENFGETLSIQFIQYTRYNILHK